MMDWGKSVKELRDKALITQNELAKMLGVSFATINRYENGHHEPTMKVKRQLMKLFKKYGVVEA
ncbi:MAG: helix-turn-helix transcriptional regulator [Erysipelotrichaceae bacterium]|nr:helix-turn-helix transcriptional regulator [Erysipelotrichaceae bacterium]